MELLFENSYPNAQIAELAIPYFKSKSPDFVVKRQGRVVRVYERDYSPKQSTIEALSRRFTVKTG